MSAVQTRSSTCSGPCDPWAPTTSSAVSSPATATSGVAKDSDVETFCALRLFIDSWRWAGVPWYLRSGKCLAETAAEVLVELKPPPQALFTDSAPADGRANYLRFRLSPNPEIALAARVKHPGEEFVGDQRELMLLNAQADAEQPYERLLATLWKARSSVHPRGRCRGRLGSSRSCSREPRPRPPVHAWQLGPKQADALVAHPGPWHNPVLESTQGQ